MIWLALIVLAVLLIGVFLYKFLNTNSLEESVDDAKKRFFPAQMKGSEESKPQRKS